MDSLTPNKPVSSRNKFYSTFGKIALVVIVLAVLVGIGIYIGKLLSGKSEDNNTSSTTNTVTNESAMVNTESNTTSNNATNGETNNSTDTDNSTTNSTATTTPTIPDNSTDLTIAGKAPFVSYKTYFPNTWSWQKDHVGSAIKLTLSRGGFTVVISQAAGGNGTCTYPGEAAGDALSTSFGEPVDIGGTSSAFRLAMEVGGGSAGDKHYTVCEKTALGGDYKLATQYGYITVTTPPEGATSDWTKNNNSVESILSLLIKQ
jgi:hypothetical protein